jgi:UPF0176 protein
LLGRILIATEGINGTLAGSEENIHAFIEHMNLDQRFKGVDWKFSAGSGKLIFSDLHVKLVKEIISTGEMRTFIDQHIAFNEDSFGGISGTGVHLTPEDFHDAILRDDGIIIDVRNEFEFEIGHFKGAKNLMTNTYSETWKALDDIIEKELHHEEVVSAEKKIFMYCTGTALCHRKYINFSLLDYIVILTPDVSFIICQVVFVVKKPLHICEQRESNMFISFKVEYINILKLLGIM